MDSCAAFFYTGKKMDNRAENLMTWKRIDDGINPKMDERNVDINT